MMFDDPLSFLSIVIWLAAASMWPVGFLFGVCSECVDCCGVRLSFERCMRVENVGGEIVNGYRGGHCPIFLAGPGGRGEAPFVEDNRLRVVDSPARITVPIQITLSAAGNSRTPVGVTRAQTWRFNQANIPDFTACDIVGPLWHLQVNLEVIGVATSEEAGVETEILSDIHQQPLLFVRVKQHTTAIAHTQQVTLFPVGFQRSDDSTFRLTSSSRNATLVAGTSVSGWSVSKAAGITIEERAITLRLSASSIYCRELVQTANGRNFSVFNSLTAVDFLNGVRTIRLPMVNLLPNPDQFFQADFRIDPPSLLCGVSADDLPTGIALGIYPMEVAALTGSLAPSAFVCNQVVRMGAGWDGNMNRWSSPALSTVYGTNGLSTAPFRFYDGWSLLWSATEGPARQTALAPQFPSFGGTPPISVTLQSSSGSIRPRDTSTIITNEGPCFLNVEISGTHSMKPPLGRNQELLDYDAEDVTWELRTSFFCDGKWRLVFGSPFPGLGINVIDGDLSAFGEPRTVVAEGSGFYHLPEINHTHLNPRWKVQVTLRVLSSPSFYCSPGVVTATVESFQFFDVLDTLEFFEPPDGPPIVRPVTIVTPIDPGASVTADYLQSIAHEPLPALPSCGAWQPSQETAGLFTRTCSSPELATTWTPARNTSRLPRYLFLAGPEQATGITQAATCQMQRLRGLSNPAVISETVGAGTCFIDSPLVEGETLRAPGPPRNLAVGRPDCSTAVLSWLPPLIDGRYPVVRYEAQFRLSTSSTWTSGSPPLNNIQALTVTIVGLDTAGYFFRVRAVSFDPSPWVEVSSNDWQPAAPQLLPVQREACDSAIVSWVPPTTSQCIPLAGYRVQLRQPIVTSTWTEAPGGDLAPDATGITLTGLLPNVAYEFRVGAFRTNGRNVAAFSTPVRIGLPPTAPTNLLVVALPATGHVSIVWDHTQETCFDVSFLVQFRRVTPPASSSFTTFATVGTAVRSSLVTGLTRGVVYRFRVVTQNQFTPTATAESADVLIPEG